MWRARFNSESLLLSLLPRSTGTGPCESGSTHCVGEPRDETKQMGCRHLSVEPTRWEQGGRGQQQQGRAMSVKPINVSPTRMSVEPTVWEQG